MTQTGTDDQGVFWEKLPEETSHTYQAFCCYRDMGITRSLKKAAEIFYADGGLGYPGTTEEPPESGTDSQLTRLKRWSRQHMWVARCEAFDAEELRARSLRMRQHRDEMLDRHRNIAMLGEKLASKVMYELLRDDVYVPVSVLPSLINSATQLHRLTLGEASERVETTGDQDQPTPDYSNLTDEEIDFLIQIGDKLHGG